MENFTQFSLQRYTQIAKQTNYATKKAYFVTTTYTKSSNFAALFE